MRKFLPVLCLFSASCGTLPEFYQAAEDIANDQAIKLEVSRETFQKETDLEVNINVTNSPKGR